MLKRDIVQHIFGFQDNLHTLGGAKLCPNQIGIEVEMRQGDRCPAAHGELF